MRIKAILPVLLLQLAAGSFSGHAQGILNNGAFIVMSGASRIYVDGAAAGDYLSQANGRITPSATGIISIEGDWTNNAGNTGFTADAGTVQLVDAAQTINGSASTTFYNLTLLGTNTKTLNVATSVGGVTTTTGVLSLGTRPLALNNFRLTVTNPAAAAITSTTGYIISETNAATNGSIVRWNIGTNTGARVIPFGTVAGVLIPLTTNTTAAMGSAADYFEVATRPTAASNNLPWTTGVTHMYDPNLAQDGSDEAVIDRWWDYRYSSNSTATITYSYRGAENTLTVPYNTGNLGAQYWSAAWLPNNANIGSAPAVLVGVGTVTAAGIPFAAGALTPTVLSSLAAPLPVELTAFSVSCETTQATVNWSTATETNNQYFEVERSADGVHFTGIGQVSSLAPNGNSNAPLHYSFNDLNPLNATTYYKLRQVDYNGDNHFSTIVTLTPCNGTSTFLDVYGIGSDVDVVANLNMEGEVTATIYDSRGRLVASQQFQGVSGMNRFHLVTGIPETGMYMIIARDSAGNQQARRVYLSR